MPSSSPRVGIGVLIRHPSQPSSRDGSPNILFGKRLGSLGAGTWAVPGGHLEYGESFAQCAARETLEETGLLIDLSSVRPVATVNSVFEQEELHYVTVLVEARLRGGSNIEPKITEPDRCERWEWTPWTIIWQWALAQANDPDTNFNAAEKLFLPFVNLCRQYPDFKLI